MTTTATILLSVMTFLLFFILAKTCTTLLRILEELKKQTALSREARNYFHSKSRVEEIMHNRDKVTYLS